MIVKLVDRQPGQAHRQGHVRPAAVGSIDPSTQAVTVRLTDGAGSYYTGTIPPGTSSAAAAAVRSSSLGTSPYALDGMQKAIIKISGGDLRTTKYAFKARGLDLEPFVAGTGTITVKVGDKCFQDNADTCALSAPRGRRRSAE